MIPRMARVGWAFTGFLVLGTSMAAAQAPRGVTLAEALRLAAQHDPNVIQAQGNLRSAGSGVRAAKSQYLPSLNVGSNGGSSFSEGPDRFDPITNQLVSGNSKSQSLNMSVSSSVDLFTGFRRGGDVKAANAREEGAGASVDESVAQSALETAGDFYSALASRELVEARKRSVARAEQQLSIAVAKLMTRSANVADSLRAVVQLGEAKLNLASEEASLARAEASLARRIGLRGRVAAMEDSSLIVPGAPLDTAAIMAEAVSRAPAVRRTEAAVREREGSLSAAKSSYWPQLNLSGNYAYAGNNANSYTLYNNRSITLGLTWPIFNRFQREQQVSQRQTELDTEIARADDKKRETSANLTTQFAALDAARERIALTRLSVQAAQADVMVALERYRLGSINITEMNAAESGLSRAEESAVNARFEYLRAKAQIEAILGRRL
ncbi:MAG TPA: TolC family protein [Gemmatimonadales bacterium]|nr:TolC family protein [Gemmatimonadales bacterium]